jgi:hypothetical protein
MGRPRTVVVIDYRKWRAGGRAHTSGLPQNEIGKGHTFLLNKLGFKCCLGFACEQLYSVPTKRMLQIGLPFGLGMSLPLFVKKTDVDVFVSTNFTAKASGINDTIEYTPKQRMELLIALFKEHGLTLRFKFVPKQHK